MYEHPSPPPCTSHMWLYTVPWLGHLDSKLLSSAGVVLGRVRSNRRSTPFRSSLSSAAVSSYITRERINKYFAHFGTVLYLTVSLATWTLANENSASVALYSSGSEKGVGVGGPHHGAGFLAGAYLPYTSHFLVSRFFCLDSFDVRSS